MHYFIISGMVTIYSLFSKCNSSIR